jgi:hypothetical protein
MMAKIDKVEDSVNVGAQLQSVKVLIDMTDERILQFNQDSKVRLTWDEGSFRELPEVIEKQLTFENAKAYIIVQQRVKEKAEKAAATITGFEAPMLDMQDWAQYKLNIRKRAGWHSYWAAPGADFDMRMGIGVYKQVRKHKVDALGNDLEPSAAPGDETGEVLKILDGDNKVELIALECPEEFYLKVIDSMSKQSVARYQSQKEGFEQTIEEQVNVHVKKDHRMKVFGDGLIEDPDK